MEESFSIGQTKLSICILWILVTATNYINGGVKQIPGGNVYYKAPNRLLISKHQN